MTETSPAVFRGNFPMLADTVHLASCSQGARSTRLDEAMREMLDSMREHAAPWGIWMGEVERARSGFAALIGAAPEEIAIVPNASVGAYQVASTLSLRERPELLTWELEFPSIAQVWLGQRDRGAEVTHLPATDARLRTEEVAAAVSGRTALVSVPLVSYANGARAEVAEVTGLAREAGARSFVDAYQAAGVVDIDVRRLGCDYLVAGALKYLLGLPGFAFLYVRGGIEDQRTPSLTGWFGRRDPFAFDPHELDFPCEARRFETGTPAIPAAYAARAGLELLSGLDIAAVERHIGGLVQDTAERLNELGYRFYRPAAEFATGPMLAVYVEDPEHAAGWLAQRRIVVSARGSVIRLSFHYYNTAEDVAAACAALAEYRGP
ncbi:aminotransferase class V-fold PLP-dependent enzyme [Sciscionella sediminilitoris]|uniref:aminotransferase class V-fold PLP-dependent enzyme n=1 Tax=Sciscionella sediminilitoris TaxID=1445613 RepID=UPI0004DF974D|nr:aminotransferase class V-fold PLP-dependent enzyme [Sciscionella sp. SE31]